MKINTLLLVGFVSVLAAPLSAFAYTLPAPVTVSQGQAYASGEGSVDFSKSSEINGTFTVSDDQRDNGEYITAGDIGSGATGYGFYAYQGMLYVAVSDGYLVRRVFADFFAPGTTINVHAKYNAAKHTLVFKTQTFNKVLGMTEYGNGIVLKNMPVFSMKTADPLRVLLNPQDYGTTDLKVMSWSYTN